MGEQREEEPPVAGQLVEDCGELLARHCLYLDLLLGLAAAPVHANARRRVRPQVLVIDRVANSALIGTRFLTTLAGASPFASSSRTNRRTSARRMSARRHPLKKGMAYCSSARS
jgi:hypothetical protein